MFAPRRTQLIVGGDEEKVKDLEYDDEKQGLKEVRSDEERRLERGDSSISPTIDHQ